MSNKLVKHNKEVEEVKETKQEIKFNIKDFLLILIIGTIAVLRYMYIDIPEFINLGETVDIILMVLSIVGFVTIAIVCGAYQSKQEGNNITVASVLKGKHKVEYKTSEKIINGINSLMRTVIIATAGCIPNKSIGLVLMVLSIVMIIIVTPKNKFKLMDIGYTAYTIGMLAVIFTLIS